MTADRVLRSLCFLTAVANIGGSPLLLVLHRPLFERLGVPLPSDLRGFVLELALSFTMGVVALFIAWNPPRSTGLLQAGIVGKGAYAVVTYHFYAFHGAHPFYLGFAAWDAAYVVIFFLYWIHLESPDLLRLHTQIAPAAASSRTHHALILGFSLTGNGRKAVERLEAGLTSRGYRVDVVPIQAAEAVFRFPMPLTGFVRIVARAFFRYPAFVAPVRPPRGDYDLVIVESPTWLLGMAAPVEAVFQDPANRWLFEGRDAAAIVVCRGAHRRSRAMMVRWLQSLGANVLTARGYEHEGWEPRRLMSLWFYLIFRRPGIPPVLAEPHYGLSDETLDNIRVLGEELASRAAARTLQPAEKEKHA
jgi:hypothetical protein